LYWVDIERGQLHRCRADGSQAGVVEIGQRIGCIALRRDRPGLIAGLEHSIALLTLDPLQITAFAAPEAHLPGNRCNDGKCDLQGRFWVGTCDTANGKATGWFYRIGPGGETQRTVGPFICTNGPAFSPDGKAIYCVDSYGRAVHRGILSADGEISAQNLFTAFDDPAWGYPDGLTCDVEGCVWIAHWGGSRVSRFSPQGDLLDVITLPVSQPSSCTFGGPDLRTLFITSASIGLDLPSDDAGLDGAVFAVNLEVGGFPTSRYNG